MGSSGGKLRPATWPEAFGAIAARLHGLSGERIGAIAGDLCDAESMLALKDLMAGLGSANIDCRQDGARIDASRRDFYVFNSSIAGIDEADVLLIVGSNPRHEAPVLNARIRKRQLANGLPVGVIGAHPDLTYKAEWLGEGPSVIAALPEAFAKTLADSKRPMIIVGQAALARPDGSAILAAAWKLASSVGALTAEWHGFNMLHTAAARVGALDLGFLPGPGAKTMDAMMGGGVDLLWLLGADEFDTGRIGADTFVVYQGHHGDRGAARADVILPGCAYVEKPGTYVNTEGRVQRTGKAVFAPGEAREDWAILRAFSAMIDKPLPYDDLEALRARLEQVNPVFGRLGFLPRFGANDLSAPAGDPAAVSDSAFVPAVRDYYQTNPISRASAVMAECTQTYAPIPALAAE